MAVATDSCACTTSMVSATPAMKRSRACSQRLVGQLQVALRDRDLVRRRLDVEEGGAHLKIDLAAQIGEFVGALFQRGPGLFDIAANSAAIEDVEIERAG